MLQTTMYRRKPFHIEAVQVTERNLHEVAHWCGGEVKTEPTLVGEGTEEYIFVEVVRPLNIRQKKAYPGDWVLKSKTGFKIYMNSAFDDCFEVVE